MAKRGKVEFGTPHAKKAVGGGGGLKIQLNSFLNSVLDAGK